MNYPTIEAIVQRGFHSSSLTISMKEYFFISKCEVRNTEGGSSGYDSPTLKVSLISTFSDSRVVLRGSLQDTTI